MGAGAAARWSAILGFFFVRVGPATEQDQAHADGSAASRSHQPGTGAPVSGSTPGPGPGSVVVGRASLNVTRKVSGARSWAVVRGGGSETGPDLTRAS